MSTDPNHMAFPLFAVGCDIEPALGLTKREYFAAMAMQGLLADPSIYWTATKIAEAAVVNANELIAALNAGEKP